MARKSPSNTPPGVATDGPHTPVNPASMSVAELARALGVPEATIRRHLEEGAPRQAGKSGGNSGGHSGGDRLNLVHYAAWLNMNPTESDG